MKVTTKIDVGNMGKCHELILLMRMRNGLPCVSYMYFLMLELILIRGHQQDKSIRKAIRTKDLGWKETNAYMSREFHVVLGGWMVE